MKNKFQHDKSYLDSKTTNSNFKIDLILERNQFYLKTTIHFKINFTLSKS